MLDEYEWQPFQQSFDVIYVMEMEMEEWLTPGRNGISGLLFISLSIVCILGEIICGTILMDILMKKKWETYSGII
jgi:hypothetical protein